jgi:hypothetical protein
MEQIDFVVESSIGDVSVQLGSDGWTAFSLLDPGDDPLIVEEIVRKEPDVATGLVTLGLPQDEANELAGELWEELDEAEKAERARLPAPRSEPD